ncbi:hypothetical protein PZA11_005619 [Diplocarpon coronariae]|uniref:Uncharacterized protein n=1 Tax=Diplocarpon coronariae TaxID=2795749 RepID=A0A218Z893_9HELO|nr:hypothetical protein B2J93_9369 [Marssonina coronariae]
MAPQLSRKLDLLDNEQLKESSDFITDYYTRVIHHRHGWAYHHAWILVLGAVFVAWYVKRVRECMAEKIEKRRY